MRFERSSGILLHVSSLASRGGIGDLGPAAHEFIDFLARARQHVWQVLPLGPTAFGNSPYAASSAFAGNSRLISLELLAEWGWIEPGRIQDLAPPAAAVDFDAVESVKMPLLAEAAGNFVTPGVNDAALAEQRLEFEQFCQAHSGWLDDFALFAHFRGEFGTAAWSQWPEPIRRRDPRAIAVTVAENSAALARTKALQFAFARQWQLLREAGARHGIRTMGDIAIFVNMDSADVWVHPDLFELDEALRPVRVAGVPPDYFSATGQRWGNPLYRWDVLRERGFGWWIDRIRRAQELYDIARLDHFRGFEAFWAIPAAEETAVHGEWVKGPGLELFRALEAALGPLPLVAEDLGLITPEVEQLRQELHMPGMKVMQFGFGDKGAHIHLPYRTEPATVAYTGTHDNDTTLGWWKTLGEAERKAVEAYAGEISGHPVWPLIRAVQASPAQLAVVPAQDLLELGSEARMNTPAVANGNWSWRAPAGCWTQKLAGSLAALAEVTDRDNDPLAAPGQQAAPEQKT